MKFRNPWIDPRICQLQPEQVQRYLLANGWTVTGPAADPQLIRFDVTNGDENAPTLFLPVKVDTGPVLRWLIDLVSDLAIWQDRYAADVLTSLLAPTDHGVSVASQDRNGSREVAPK
jgi:hypothetical protein